MSENGFYKDNLEPLLKWLREYLPVVSITVYVLAIVNGTISASFNYSPFDISYFDFATVQDLLYLGVLEFDVGMSITSSFLLIYLAFKAGFIKYDLDLKSVVKLIALVAYIVLSFINIKLSYNKFEPFDAKEGHADTYRVMTKTKAYDKDCLHLLGSTAAYFFWFDYLKSETIIIPRSEINAIQLVQKGIPAVNEGIMYKRIVRTPQAERDEWEKVRLKTCNIDLTD
ncbi:hypothetical protein AB4331_05845 [Vibrio breoganii]